MTMNEIRNALLIGLALVVISTARAGDPEAVKKDMAGLQGQWSMVSAVVNGNPMPDEVRAAASRVTVGNVVTVMAGTNLLIQANITIDPSKNPKAMDYHMIGGHSKGYTTLGIYELEGDTLKSCYGPAGTARPSDFSNKAGDHRTSSIWKRLKK
jgi:uncharacterized protein (TIGR03067 family)